jgi:hypothetical protein
MKVLLAAALLMVGISACASGTSGTGQVTVGGRVLAAPSCPIAREGSACPPKPVTGAVVDAVANGDTVASTTSGSDGTFTLQLPAGRYSLTAKVSAGFPATAMKDIDVPAAGLGGVTLTLDSGIR